ncbi:hypothetical protein Hanom_Chr09g00796841 [Helianthus anomalus]
MLNNPPVKPTPPYWKKGKQINPDKALKLKRMRAELVAASYGTARSIARWFEAKIVETYKRLEHLRAKDPFVLQKPVYPLTAVIPQQTQTSKKMSSASALSIAALKQVKRQKQTDEADEQMFENMRKEGIRCQLDYHKNLVADKLPAKLRKTIAKLASRTPSPNSSSITFQPRRPADPKILKWK